VAEPGLDTLNKDFGRARLGAGAESVLVCRQIQPTTRISSQTLLPPNKSAALSTSCLHVTIIWTDTSRHFLPLVGPASFAIRQSKNDSTNMKIYKACLIYALVIGLASFVGAANPWEGDRPERVRPENWIRISDTAGIVVSHASSDKIAGVLYVKRDDKWIQVSVEQGVVE
jgi:hypothetical protein